MADTPSREEDRSGYSEQIPGELGGAASERNKPERADRTMVNEDEAEGQEGVDDDEALLTDGSDARLGAPVSEDAHDGALFGVSSDGGGISVLEDDQSDEDTGGYDEDDEGNNNSSSSNSNRVPILAHGHGTRIPIDSNLMAYGEKTRNSDAVVGDGGDSVYPPGGRVGERNDAVHGRLRQRPVKGGESHSVENESNSPGYPHGGKGIPMTILESGGGDGGDGRSETGAGGLRIRKRAVSAVSTSRKTRAKRGNANALSVSGGGDGRGGIKGGRAPPEVPAAELAAEGSYSGDRSSSSPGHGTGDSVVSPARMPFNAMSEIGDGRDPDGGGAAAAAAAAAANGGDDDDDDQPSSTLSPSEIMRNMNAMAIGGRDEEAQMVIEALQEVYVEKLRPIEERSKFDQFHHEVMTDAELQAKPQVLLLGPYSSGKTSTIRHLIGQDFPAMHIAPEPSTDAFQVVMAGADERTIKGAALCIVDELPYTGLGKFGAPFLSKFQAATAPARLLDHLTFVDTPGILAAERHGVQRGYPFAKVVKWFADRSDLILLMFDAHKLDLGEEFREVIDVIAKHGDRVRVVLNKAQEVDSDRLIKVYGALMWTIGRALRGKADAPKVYVGSFWDGPRRHPDDRADDDDSLDHDEARLLREMMELPKNVGLRKINDMIQRAKLVKIHLHIMFAITDRMPRLWGKEAAQERIMDSLEEIFAQVQTEAKVSEADMPDVDEYRQGLGRLDFKHLPRRSRRLLLTLDDIIERDIKQCVTRAGGVRKTFKLESRAKVGAFLPTPSGSLRQRRATVGGGRRGSTRGVGGGSRFGRSRRAPMMADKEGWDSPPGSVYMASDMGEDEGLADGTSFPGQREGGGGGDVPIVLATVVIAIAMLLAAGVAAWKTDTLPPEIARIVNSLLPKAAALYTSR